jgi:hypothetical protein
VRSQVRQLQDAAAEWPELTASLSVDGDRKASRAQKVRESLGREGSFALFARKEGGAPAGALLAERRKDSWIFEEDVASVRFFRALDHESERALLAEAERVARERGSTHLAISRRSGSNALRRLQDAGYAPYMETLRAEMPSVPDEEAESESAGVRIGGCANPRGGRRGR